MSIELIPNRGERNFGTILSHSLEDAVTFKMASAYLNWGGLENLKNPIERILRKEGKVQVLHEADLQITEPKAIAWLSEVDSLNQRMKYRVVIPTIARKFHPKMYILKNAEGQYTAIIGSSNTTRGGLYANDEVNVVVKGDRKFSVIADSLDAYDSYITREQLVQPSADFLTTYTCLYERSRDVKLQDSDTEFGSLYEELRKFESNWTSPNWIPKSQKDYVVLAMQIAEREKFHSSNPQIDGFHLREIQKWSMALAKESGDTFEWPTWHNSIRAVLNLNTLGKEKGEKLFERVGGEGSRSGVYKLSEKGRKYAR